MRPDYAVSLEALQGKMKKGNFDVPLLIKKIRTLLRKDSACSQSAFEKDMAEIERSSRMLGLSEFRYFQLAYSQWYGRALPEQAMERIFADYLFRNIVPFWVRHLSRSVLSRQFQGAAELQQFRTPAPDQATVTPGMTVACLVCYMILSGLIVFL